MHHFLRPAPAALLSITLATVLLLPGCTKQHIGSTPPGARTPSEVHGGSKAATPRVEIVQSRPQPVPLTSAREDQEVVVSGNALPRPKAAATLEEESLSGHPTPTDIPHEMSEARTAGTQTGETASDTTGSVTTNTANTAGATPAAVPANAGATVGTTSVSDSGTTGTSTSGQASKTSPAAEATVAPAEVPETPPATSELPSAKPTAPTPAPPAPTSPTYDSEGMASWISTDLQGEPTASGELYDIHSMTASHRTLPMGTRLEVTNLENGKSVEVRVNDRGPFVKERLVDVSYAAAQKLGLLKKGVAKVGIRVLPEGGAPSATTAQEPARETATPPSDATAPSAAAASAQPAADQPTTESATSEPPASMDEQPSASTTAAPAGERAEESASSAEESANEETPAPVAAKAATDGAYFIQVGAFTHHDNAQRMLEHLRAQGYPGSRMVQTTRNGQPLYQVQAGAFRELDEAGKALSTLKETYTSSFLIRD